MQIGNSLPKLLLSAESVKYTLSGQCNDYLHKFGHVLVHHFDSKSWKKSLAAKSQFPQVLCAHISATCRGPFAEIPSGTLDSDGWNIPTRTLEFCRIRKFEGGSDCREL